MIFKEDDKSVINDIERNLHACSLLLGRAGNGFIYNDGDIKWVYTGTRALNRAFIVKADDKDIGQKINRILSLFRDKGAPANLIVNTALRLDNLVEKFKKAGMAYKNSWCGMALELDKYINKPVPVPGYEVLKVDNEEMLKNWSSILSSSFSVPDSMRDDYSRVYSKLGYREDKPWTYYIGFKDGAAVSCCMSFSEDGVTGLYWVGTLPEARKQGLASRIVSRAIDDAITRGSHLSILQASAAGKPVYEKLGFNGYCKFDIYSWTPGL